MKKDKLYLNDHLIKGINTSSGISIFLVLALVSLLGCKKDDDNNNPPPPQQVQTLSVTDSVFVRKVSLFNLAELDLGRLALANSSDDSVKIFAAAMVNQLTLAQSELNTLALQRNVPVPLVTDSLHNAVIQRLQFLNGAEFNNVLISTVITDHQNIIQEFTTEIKSGEDQGIINYANKYLPLINDELQKALRLQANMTR